MEYVCVCYLLYIIVCLKWCNQKKSSIIRTFKKKDIGPIWKLWADASPGKREFDKPSLAAKARSWSFEKFGERTFYKKKCGKSAKHLKRDQHWHLRIPLLHMWCAPTSISPSCLPNSSLKSEICMLMGSWWLRGTLLSTKQNFPQISKNQLCIYSVHQWVCRRSHIRKTRCNMYLPVLSLIKQQTQLSRSSDHLGKGFKPLSEIQPSSPSSSLCYTSPIVVRTLFNGRTLTCLPLFAF